MTNEKDKRIKELEEENRRLKEENKELKETTDKLTKILTLFCNPHTPPSKQRLKRKNKAKVSNETPKKIGAPIGHKAGIRETPEPTKTRKKLYDDCVVEMQQWIDLANSYSELKKFGEKLSNGLKHWFTRILYPFVEATNNIAERALRELVVIRKIIGSLRNHKGAKILETMMTMITTWRQRKLDTFSELKASI